MREKSLRSIISLFSALAVIKSELGTLYRNMLEVFLSTQFSAETVDTGLDEFEYKISYYKDLNLQGKTKEHYLLNEIEAHCYILSRELVQSQRLLILQYLMDFEPSLFFVSGKSYGREILATIAAHLGISESDFLDCLAFVNESYENISDKNNLLIISDNKELDIPGINIHYLEGLSGKLVFIQFNRLNTILFKVNGESRFLLGNHHLFNRRTYLLENGNVIYYDERSFITYNDIIRLFNQGNTSAQLNLQVCDLEYKFPNGNYGINKVSFSACSGELMAIMGGSGSGKTTLMNLLIGLYKPLSGSITINGVSIHKNPTFTKGYIGYVPQDDALYENLTAFENLYFIANLSLKNISSKERIFKVNYLLKELGLWKIRDLKVGSPLDKIISGGQRKRLNIALELIRDPGILFLDEPTSGLSSSDSKYIMSFLRDMASRGRLIIMNIHQPSSYIFKMFDKLLFIDQGGYPAYFGPSMNVVSYLKTKLRFVDAHQSECPHCGNLNPDDIFNLIQVEQVRSVQREKTRRLMAPNRWHRHFLEELGFYAKQEVFKPLEPPKLNIPGIIEQFAIYFNRNFLIKIKDYQYLLLSLVLTPVLGLMLSLFSRNINPSVGVYQYYENDNMPAFIFMSVIVALFVGLMSGATEIIKDRQALKRESFLNLSYGSYFFSKLSFLILLSGIQMMSYSIVSHLVLEIPYISGSFFFILWISAISANSVGLLLSSFFKTIASVYVAVPFLLIPQILFSGAVLDFNKINPVFSSEKYVPAFADLMVSRWAFEAISVSLFINNSYSHKFYDIDKELARCTYYRNFLLPEMEKDFFLNSYSSSYFITHDSLNYKLIKDGLNQIEQIGIKYPNEVDIINGEEFLSFLKVVRNKISSENDSLQSVKDEIIDGFSTEAYNDFKKASVNKKLEEVLTDEKNFNKVIVSNNSYVRKLYPIYFDGTHGLGRAHFYAPQKRVGQLLIQTPMFNAFVILIFIIIISLMALARPIKY